MIVKSDFSYQLLYRKKAEDTFTEPILLWESPKIEQCLLTIIGNEIHATCMVGGKLQRAISTDGGDTFGPLSQYMRKFCAEPAKAHLLESSDGYYARQVYIDRAAPWDVQMLPDLIQGFYPTGEKPDASTRMSEMERTLEAAQKALEAKDRQILELMYQSKQ